ncbi:MAG: hypothetical protein LAQ69_17425 [Acidobacteriia bacterium]|nr:hypothetical protein [Terriglobia bacterium]
MKPHLLLATILLAGTTAYAADSKPGQTTNAAAAFARLKTLVGEWEADTEMGKAHLSYELIAGGTALVERFSSDKMAPMLTVYHFNGDRLMLTHYCEAGNQPRMLAGPFNPETGELEFQFLDATNLASASDGHMHSARIRLIDNSHMASEWQFYEKGERKFTENARYTRVK